MNQSEIVRLETVSKVFEPTEMSAVDRVSLSLPEGEILALLGPSGCGKTTLLRLIAGFERPEGGRIEIAGRAVAGGNLWVPPEQRHLGMVFQEYALFPHLTVAKNVAFGLNKWGKTQVEKRVAEAIALVGLSGLEQRYPHQLSGGQRQRVALARALAPSPDVVLLDEPLSNLDLQVRLYLRQEIRKILKRTGTTGIFVTHDREEALAISDRVAVMRQGGVEQLGTPEEIYGEPISRFVAGFVTEANFLPARRRGTGWETEVGWFEVPGEGEEMEGELMIRESDAILTPDAEGTMVICDRQFLGREHRYCAIGPQGTEIHARSNGGPVLQVGVRVKLSAAADKLRLFPTR